MSSQTSPQASSLLDPILLPGAEMPRLGLGVYGSPPHVTGQSVATALANGYRHIDTAQYYENEAQVGQAVLASGLARSSVFITTKILQPGDTPASTVEKCWQSARLLGGYADLFLIHSPRAGDKAVRTMWQALERLRNEGGARAIGVSNFGARHLEAMRPYALVWPPHVNQLELHPWCQQREAVQYCRDRGVALQAYCPIVRNQKADEPTLGRLAAKYAVSPNQVLIRWSLQKGWVPLPKSDDAGRIAENAHVFGFELEMDDVATLDRLDEGPRGAIVEAVEN